MSNAYDTETKNHNGKQYRIEWVADHDTGAPWENYDCHGIVSEWTRRDKTPGELILCTDRGGLRRYYDFAETMKIAKRDSWGSAKTGEARREAVMRDYEYLKSWCNNEWRYVGLVVTLLDNEGEETEIDASLWGIESNAYECHQEVIGELISECEQQQSRLTYPVTHCGI